MKISDVKSGPVLSVLFIFSAICLAVLLVIGSSLPVSAQGTVLYGAQYAGEDGPATLYRVDPATGDATIVGPIGYERCGGMDFDAAGTLFATAERADSTNTSVLITINPMTGAGTEVGEIGLDHHETFFDVSFRNSDEILFTSTYFEDTISCIALNTINTATGMGTHIGHIGTCDPGNAIAFSPTDILFYWNSDGNMLYTLNQTTGQATNVTPLLFPESLTLPTVNAMDFHPISGVLFATVKDKSEGGEEGRDGPGAPKYLTTIDTETGVVTIVGPTINDLDAIAFSSDMPVGGEVLPVNKAGILSPWIMLLALIVLGGAFTVIKRRYTC